MYRLLFTVLCVLCICRSASATGVAVVDATKGIYLHLDTSKVVVKVDGQVTRITSYFVFRNTDTANADISFAFPVPNGGSVSGLRFRFGSYWTTTALVAQKQDTAVPASGPSIDQKFINYIGPTPLIFDIPGIVAPDSLIAVEFEYVQLLPYDLGTVRFTYPGNYTPIQQAPVASTSFVFTLGSKRVIDALTLTSHPATASTLTPYLATVETEMLATKLEKDFSIEYRLNSQDLGLFGYSTFLDSTCDGRPKGVMLFIAEPDASEEVEAIAKTFTLVIDRSGSMGGSKIAQARDAASFIISNLNLGDKFNLISFASEVTPFRSAHVDFNATTQAEALSFIGNIGSNGGTNIHDALLTSLDQFPPSDPGRASIIIFFTDGLVSNEETICKAVQQKNAGKDVILYCFGIGSDVNKRLLTRLADENGGLVSFVGADDLYSSISDFYLRIRNPLLLDPVVTFDPDVVDEIYPRKLPNLYKGQQLFVTGRYASPVSPLTINISGLAYGKQVSYSYPMNLVDTVVPDYAFLPKIWAKMKIEDLMVDYNLLKTNSPEQDSVKEEVIGTSLCFNVASVFTSFQVRWDGSWGQDTTGTGGGGPAEVETSMLEGSNNISILAYPNPFTRSVEFTFTVTADIHESTEVHIYDLLGRLVRTLPLSIVGIDTYSIVWDGKDTDGNEVRPGSYFICARINNELHSGQLMKH